MFARVLVLVEMWHSCNSEYTLYGIQCLNKVKFRNWPRVQELVYCITPDELPQKTAPMYNTTMASPTEGLDTTQFVVK